MDSEGRAQPGPSQVRSIVPSNLYAQFTAERKKGRGEKEGNVDGKGTGTAMIFLLHFALLSLYTRRPAIYPFRDSRL